MRVRGLIAAIVSMLVLAGGVPAAAGTATNPDFTDPCGTDGVVTNPSQGATTPWTDICAGWFETLPGAVPGLKVTAAFADEIDDDRLGYYEASWWVGACRYKLSHDRGMGRYGSNGVFVDDPGGDWLEVRCGEPIKEPCPLPNIPANVCDRYPDTRTFLLADAVAVTGNTVTWTVRFDRALSELAGDFAPGTVLTGTHLHASNKVGFTGFGLTSCFGTICNSVLMDGANGRAYTIGQ